MLAAVAVAIGLAVKARHEGARRRALRPWFELRKPEDGLKAAAAFVVLFGAYALLRGLLGR